MDLVGKPNTTSPIWNHFHSCHPSAFVQVSSNSRDRKCTAGQVCIGEAFSKLAKYERDRGKWKMLTRNVATYAAIPIPQKARAADKELTHQYMPMVAFIKIHPKDYCWFDVLQCCNF